MTRPYVLGLTGNIATGKSTVLAMLANLGATVIDADHVYHDLIAPDRPLWHAIRQRFGPTVIAPEGHIDRRALAGVVFSDQAALADLDALTHPAVITAVNNRIATLDGGIVVVDAVKLIESGMADACDQVWLVTCDPSQQVERLMRRNELSRLDAERRVVAQPPIEPKIARADTIIDNSGSLAATRQQVEAAWNTLSPLISPEL